MKNISDTISQYRLFEVKPEYKNITNERQLVIQDFLTKLNLERKGTQYKPLTARGVAVKLGHLQTWELKIFWSQCCGAKNFTKYFWWSLKPQK